jgi:uncharacterized membrane protein YfcA
MLRVLLLRSTQSAARLKISPRRPWHEFSTVATADQEHQDPLLSVKTLAFGALAGTTGALVGLGGAFMVLPWLTGPCRLPQSKASGTSLAAVFLTAIGSLVAYGLTSESSAERTDPSAASQPKTVTVDNKRHVDYRTAIAMVVASAPMSVVGARVARSLSDRKLKLIVIGFQLLVTPLIMFKEDIEKLVKPSVSSKPAFTPPVSLWSPELTDHDRRALALGCVSGMVAGLFGVGGGLIVVPGLFLFGPDLDYKTVLGTSFACMVPTAFLGACQHALQGTMVTRLAVPIGIGSLVGSFIGGNLSRHIDEHYLRALFGAVMLGSAFKLSRTLPPRAAAAKPL